FTQAYGKHGEDGIYVGSIDSPEFKLVSAGPSSNPAYASGYLLLVREGKLLTQPLNLRRLQSTAAPSLVSDGVRMAFDRRAAYFSVAQNGTLVFLSAVGSGQRLGGVGPEGERYRV